MAEIQGKHMWKVPVGVVGGGAGPGVCETSHQMNGGFGAGSDMSRPG